MGWKDYARQLLIVLAVLAPNIGGIIGAFITKGSIDEWYEQLKKPDWRPPNYLFGPVWTCLYIAMGYASYRVWKNGGGFSGKAKVALWLYIIQLLLNWAWTPLFFGFHLLKASAIEIIVLSFAIKFTMFFFFRTDWIAGALLVPYLAWVMFASVLNFWIYRQNTYD